MRLTQWLLVFVAVFAGSISVEATRKYDYIVVGGGTAGCVAAARLSENPRNSVLLIEAGGDNSDQGAEVTGTGPVIFPGKPFVDIQGPNIIPMRSRESSPGAYTSNHYIPITRSLGGGSSTNGQCYSRLGAQDWEYFDINGWGYEDVLPFQKRVESYQPHVESGENPSRGSSGPVSITNYVPGQLSSSIINTMASVLGLPIKADLDSGDARGVSQFGRNSKPTDYTRESSWTAYLKPVFASRPNLFIQTDAVVNSIEWKTEKVRGQTRLVRPLVAEGVYYTISSIPEDVTEFARAREEIVIAAGVMNSPKLLMLSGVGPAAHLASRGIELALASEQVGKNLQDHISLPTMSFLFAEPAVTDRVLPVAFGSTGLRADNILDYEIAFVQAANGITIAPGVKASVVVSIPVLTRSSANGTVQLLDSNPRSNPIIDFKAFKDPIDTLALQWLGNATRTIAMKTPGFITESAPSARIVPIGSPLSAWNLWFQNTAAFSGAKSYAHFVGTCSMSDSIATGVVDNKLKVFGTSNVRVADLSVIPRTVSQRPFGTALMVGERVADFILTGQ